MPFLSALVAGVAGLCLSLPVHAQFRSDRDRQIVHDVLRAFTKECVQRVAADGEMLKRIETDAKIAHGSGEKEVSQCYENTFSQISGVHYLYGKLCDDVSSTISSVSDPIAAKQLLEVNKYQLGIRPFHSTLNDCLYGTPEKRGAKYIIPLSGLDLDVKTLEHQIERIKIPEPFAHTLVPLR